MSDESGASSAPSSPSGEPALERAQGYKQMATQDGAPPKPKAELESAREAGDELLKKRRRQGQSQAKVEEIAYRNRDGSIADPNETVTLNRAADDRKEYIDQRVAAVAAIEAFYTAQKFDAQRVAEGIAPTEPNQPQLEQQHVDPAAQQFEQDAVANGVDPNLAKTLAYHPQARQALESEFEKVGKLQQQHETQIQIAQHFARDQWLSQFPELARFPIDKIAPELVKLHQTNPARAKAAMASLQRVGDMAAMAEHHQAQRAHVERQQFAVEAARQDQIFERSIGYRSPAQRQAIGQEAFLYAQELGIDKNTLTHLLQTNPILRSAAFQHMMHTAIEARIAKKSGATYRDKLDRTVPPVSRPGHSNNPRVNRSDANLAALAKKANTTGGLRDMAALLAASRKERR